MIFRLHRHIHSCIECGREFFICSRRDCDLAPQVCAGCEQDRMDDYLNVQERLNQLDTYKELHPCPTSMTPIRANISKPRT